MTGMVVASGSPSPGMTPQVMVLFGTGQKNPLTNTQGATYATGTQSLYGVWDWNMAAWNSVSGATYASLANNNPAVPSGGSAGTNTLQQANLQQQTVTVNTSTGNRDILTNATLCWAGNCCEQRQVRLVPELPGHAGAGDLQPRAGVAGAHGQLDRAGAEQPPLVRDPERYGVHLRALGDDRRRVQPGVPAAQ